VYLMALTAPGFRRRRASAAEILVLRRQLALYTERGIKPRASDRGLDLATAAGRRSSGEHSR
jgi:hypothetical protein